MTRKGAKIHRPPTVPGEGLFALVALSIVWFAGRWRCFSLSIRAKLARAPKRAAISLNLEHAKVGTHSLRAGGAALMFAMWFELEGIKRRGRRLATAFRNYFWRDEHILAHIGREWWKLLRFPGSVRNNPPGEQAEREQYPLAGRPSPTSRYIENHGRRDSA